MRIQPIGATCPRCNSTNTVLHVEGIQTLGTRDPVGHVAKGAECEECGLKFVTDEVRQIANNDPRHA